MWCTFTAYTCRGQFQNLTTEHTALALLLSHDPFPVFFGIIVMDAVLELISTGNYGIISCDTYPKTPEF